ncbi:MAG: hypothetical protein M0Z99_32015 [Betaproteobacteria bacterium]|nr:hypothetical protein [Betaproteobacteria bacterium]
MRNLIVVAALAIAIPAFAQQQPQRPSDEEINARIQALTAQRNEAQDRLVIVSGKVEAEITRLTAELDKAQKEAAACKPKDEPTKK